MRKLIFSLTLAVFLAGSATAQVRMIMNTPIYDDNADAKKEIREALVKAKTQHKRLLLVFGANWCYDCHVLDYYFHHPDIQPLLDKGFLVIHVDIGQGEKNVDLANKYQIPLQKGVPAVAVVDKSGALLFSQQHGEFEKARSLPERDIIAFLQQWAPTS